MLMNAGTCTQGEHELADMCLARSSFRYGLAFLTNCRSVHPGFTTTRQLLVNPVRCYRSHPSHLQPRFTPQSQKPFMVSICRFFWRARQWKRSREMQNRARAGGLDAAFATALEHRERAWSAHLQIAGTGCHLTWCCFLSFWRQASKQHGVRRNSGRLATRMLMVDAL